MNFKEKLLKIKLNKKLFLKIYIPIVIILAAALIILQILGSKSRAGYLSEFDLLETNYNENTTNYSYHFKIGYYNKTFKHSDIYGVYPDLSNLPEFIKEIKMDEAGSPFGNLIFDRIINEEKIDINYNLKLKSKIIKTIFFILSLILIIYSYKYISIFVRNIFKIIKNTFKITDTFLTTKNFILLTIAIGIILFIFQFWLGFPGHFQNVDMYWTMFQALNNSYENWHPIIISLTLHFLYKIFGYHSFYLFFINLFLFYLGLYLIIISLYYKFKNKSVILLYFLIFVKELFFMNFAQDKDATFSLFVWLLYSLILFQLLVPINKKYIKLLLKIFTGIILLFSLLWRHNGIVTIYPVFILFTYLYLKNKEIKNIKTYIKSFALIMLLSAFILVFIVKIFPIILEDNKNYPTRHLFLLQIAACSVPANDDSLIPLDWYIEGKTFEDVKKTYNVHPLNADRFGELMITPLPNLKRVWIKYILKYPINYIKHIGRFVDAYITKMGWYPIMDSKSIQGVDPLHINSIFGKATIHKLNKKEQIITFTPLREKIYDFLFNNTIHIVTIFPIIISFMIFIINFILIFIKKMFNSSILIYSFSASISAIATFEIVILFTPAIIFRYIYPVYPLSIISLISFITFIYDRGGFKKFFKELGGNNDKN